MTRRTLLATAGALLLLILLAAALWRHHSPESGEPVVRRAVDAIGKGQIVLLTDATDDTKRQDTVRFGRLHAGETALRRLWIANGCSRPIVLTDCIRSCGCTTLEFDRQPIAPGEAQQATLYFDSRGEQGWQLKTLDLQAAGCSAGLRLWIEAEVE